MVKYKTKKPREYCTDELLKKLLSAKFQTKGHTVELESFLGEYGKPIEYEESWAVTVNGYFVSTFEYVDCLAEECLLLRQFKLI